MIGIRSGKATQVISLRKWIQARQPPHDCPRGIDRFQSAMSALHNHSHLIFSIGNDPHFIATKVDENPIVSGGKQHSPDIVISRGSTKGVDLLLPINRILSDKGMLKPDRDPDGGLAVLDGSPGGAIESDPQ
jgi:hypothetical protein